MDHLFSLADSYASASPVIPFVKGATSAIIDDVTISGCEVSEVSGNGGQVVIVVRAAFIHL